MEFTGERYIPTEQGKIRLEHYHRYAIVLEFLANKRVLDIASGEGYGSAMMAQVAESVVGVDIDKEAIEHAKLKYKKENIEFRLGSCSDMPVKDKSIDVVVSFETIEHHNQHEEMIKEIKRVLTDEGILIISSPNKYEYSDALNYSNPFHVKELYREELLELISRNFTKIELFSQRVVYGSAIFSDSSIRPIVIYENSQQDIIKKSRYLRPIYDIVLASNTEIPMLDNTILESDINVLFTAHNKHITQLSTTLESVIADRDAKAAGMVQLQQAFDTASANYDKHVAQLSTTLESVIADRDAKAAGMVQLQQAFDTAFANCNKHVAQLSTTLESVIADRDAKAAGMVQLQQAFDTASANYDKHVAQLSTTLESVIADRDAKAAGMVQLQQAFDTASANCDKHAAQLSTTLESVIADRDAKAAGMVQLQQAFDTASADCDKHVTEINLIETRHDALKGETLKLQKELLAVYQSRTWRLSAPLRKLVEFVKPKNNCYIDRTPFTTPSLQENTSYNDIKTSRGDKVYSYTTRILLVSYYCPTRAHAGGLRILDLYALIKQQCPDIQLDIFTHHRPDIDWKIDDIYNIFHNIYLSPSEDLTLNRFEELARDRLPYDIVDLQFHQCLHHISLFRPIGKKILFTPMESYSKNLYLELRSSPLSKRKFSLRRSVALLRYTAEEIFFLPKVDEVICVSKSDAAFLRTITSLHNIHGIETGISQFEFSDALSLNFSIPPASERLCKVLYIAYFGSETNINALHWYLDNVHSTIKAKVANYKLTVVGRGDLSQFSKYNDSSIEILGEVPSLAPYIREARVGIAPALSGSGFRGKINQYAVMGVPSVVSPISFKGLSYKNNIDIFVAESPEEFASKCIQLLLDEHLNDSMGQSARNMCMRHYTWQSKWNAVRKIYNLKEII